MHENEVALKDWKSVALEVIEQLKEFQKTMPEFSKQTFEQKLVETKVMEAIVLLYQLEALERNMR